MAPSDSWITALLAPLLRPLGFVPASSASARLLDADAVTMAPPASETGQHSVVGLAPLPLSMAVLTDSYKATHMFQYPDARRMVAYGEFRKPFNGDKSDERMVLYGLRYIIENYVCRRWTEADVINAEKFFETHNAGKTPFPFPKDVFLKFVRENNGYFPVRIEALPEGSVVYPHDPAFQIIAEGEYSRLCTFLETVLTMVWYPSTVATLSRKAHTAIKEAFETSVDDSMHGLLASRLHDFGMRGCTCLEQTVIGGAAHLLSFDGSDTLSSAYFVQFTLNEGRPIGESIPATEHSVMTSFRSEREAIENMIRQFGSGVFACVMDSYDYVRALTQVLPSVASYKTERGGFMVVRPDSGEPVEVVLQALRAGEKIFGADVNSKGYKVLRGMGVIQGDGINLQVIHDILKAVHEAGFSAQNVAFGMGAGLLQKVNRDTMSFATKLSHITYANGEERNVMKAPKTDAGKVSLPGELAVKYNADGIPMVVPKSSIAPSENAMRVIYDCGPVEGFAWDSFDAVRARLNEQWARLPRNADVVSEDLKALIKVTREEQLGNADRALEGMPTISID